LLTVTTQNYRKEEMSKQRLTKLLTVL